MVSDGLVVTQSDSLQLAAKRSTLLHWPFNRHASVARTNPFRPVAEMMIVCENCRDRELPNQRGVAFLPAAISEDVGDSNTLN